MQTAFSEYYPEDDTTSTMYVDWRLSWALRMSSVGFYSSYNATDNNGAFETNSFINKGNTLDPLLNNARASYEGGVFQFRKGSFNYMCTRNNNFSNRDQKGTIIVN